MAALRLALFLLCLLAPGSACADPVDNWRPQIEVAARRFALPPEWIARVMRIESGGKTHRNGVLIRSRAGAMGLMQLMPSTWADMRVRLGLGSDPDNPEDNIVAGAAYLRLMYDRFGYPGLFGAYNAGPARYAAALSGAASLPSETRDYLAAATGEGTQLRSLVRANRSVAAGPPGALARAAPADPRRSLFFALNASRSGPGSD